MVQIKHMFDLEERAVQTQRLSKRQQQIYDFICSEVASKGYPPSVREIADAVGLRSPSTVHVHLQVLEDRGYIKRNLSKSRALEVVHTQDAETFDDAKETPASDANMVRLPLLGRVAAGEPILAVSNVEEYMTLPRCLVGDEASFILKVKGDSMIGAGIFNGDYVVVKQQPDAVSGEIVVAQLEDEATVKTFYRERDTVRLQPENPTMQPIYARNPRILGRVVALIRTM